MWGLSRVEYLNAACSRHDANRMLVSPQSQLASVCYS